MKLKLLQMVVAYEALRRLANQPFPALIAYRIQKNIRALEADVLAYEKTRQELIRNKYGVKSTGPGKSERYDVPPEKMQKFASELKPLQEQELEISILTISLDSIHQITPLDLMAIEWMFEEAEKPSLNQSSTKSRVRHRK